MQAFRADSLRSRCFYSRQSNSVCFLVCYIPLASITQSYDNSPPRATGGLTTRPGRVVRCPLGLTSSRLVLISRVDGSRQSRIGAVPTSRAASTRYRPRSRRRRSGSARGGARSTRSYRTTLGARCPCTCKSDTRRTTATALCHPSRTRSRPGRPRPSGAAGTARRGPGTSSRPTALLSNLRAGSSPRSPLRG